MDRAVRLAAALDEVVTGAANDPVATAELDRVTARARIGGICGDGCGVVVEPDPVLPVTACDTVCAATGLDEVRVLGTAPSWVDT